MTTDFNRHFVQYMLKKGIIPKRNVLPVLAKLNVDGKYHQRHRNVWIGLINPFFFADVTDEASLETFLSRINRKISRHYFKISFVTCEVTGAEFLVWLNTKNDSVAKQQDTFTPAELEYFQLIMGEIVNSDEKYLPHNICLNLSGTLAVNVMYKTQAQATIKKWVKGGYLVELNGKIYFGPRCIHEFSSYFRRQEDGVNICSLCSEIVFVVCFFCVLLYLCYV